MGGWFIVKVPTDLNKFTKPTRETLAKRASQVCSNPYCQKPTVGPHSEEDKSVDVGEAAHIRGAQPGSKRFDPTMTSVERSSITNGIWLCRTCAKLIDSDERKYTVEILYEWKRNHESRIEQSLSSSGWQRTIREKSVHFFEKESAAALQIAIDQPENWEYLLTVELLRHKLGSIKRDFDELKRGLLFRPMKSLSSKEQFLLWLQDKLVDLENLIHFLSVSATEELMSAWGKFGTSGDALEILRATNKIAEGCNGLLDWEIDLNFTRFPDGFESIKAIMAGWTYNFRSEMDRIPDEIKKIFDGPHKVEGTFNINLNFEPPENINELMPEVQRL